MNATQPETECDMRHILQFKYLTSRNHIQYSLLKKMQKKSQLIKKQSN